MGAVTRTLSEIFCPTSSAADLSGSAWHADASAAVISARVRGLCCLAPHPFRSAAPPSMARTVSPERRVAHTSPRRGSG
jgi:hypothetical protein